MTILKPLFTTLLFLFTSSAAFAESFNFYLDQKRDNTVWENVKAKKVKESTINGVTVNTYSVETTDDSEEGFDPKTKLAFATPKKPIKTKLPAEVLKQLELFHIYEDGKYLTSLFAPKGFALVGVMNHEESGYIFVHPQGYYVSILHTAYPSAASFQLLHFANQKDTEYTTQANISKTKLKGKKGETKFKYQVSLNNKTVWGINSLTKTVEKLDDIELENFQASDVAVYLPNEQQDLAEQLLNEYTK